MANYHQEFPANELPEPVLHERMREELAEMTSGDWWEFLANFDPAELWDVVSAALVAEEIVPHKDHFLTPDVEQNAVGQSIASIDRALYWLLFDRVEDSL